MQHLLFFAGIFCLSLTNAGASPVPKYRPSPLLRSLLQPGPLFQDQSLLDRHRSTGAKRTQALATDLNEHFPEDEPVLAGGVLLENLPPGDIAAAMLKKRPTAQETGGEGKVMPAPPVLVNGVLPKNLSPVHFAAAVLKEGSTRQETGGEGKILPSPPVPVDGVPLRNLPRAYIAAAMMNLKKRSTAQETGGEGKILPAPPVLVDEVPLENLPPAYIAAAILKKRSTVQETGAEGKVMPAPPSSSDPETPAYCSTPECIAMMEEYEKWRQAHGYGTVGGRWG